MAGTSDTVFLRAFSWFQASVTFLQGQAAPAALADALRTRLGLELDKTAATIDPSAFAATRAAAQSLALATLITGETVAALKTLGEVLAHLDEGAVNLDDLVKVVRQIDRIVGAQPGKPPSAYSIAKLLLILSGDADAPAADPPARRLVHIVKGLDPAGGGLNNAQVLEGQAILGLSLMALGTLIDRSFSR
ncbi:MAG: hypothetical protein ABIR94_00930, partial [Rubrivivax sp.]